MSEPLALVAFALALASLALGVWGAWGCLRLNLNAEMFSQVLLRTLKDGNINRALKLCSAAGQMPMAHGTRAMLRLADSSTPTSENSGYRAGATSIEQAREQLREAYERAAAPLLQTLRRYAWMAAGAACLLASSAALWLPWRPHPMEVPYPVVMAGSALALIVGTRSWQSVRKGTPYVLDRLLEPLAQAWLRGTLHDAPPPPPPPPRPKPAPPPPPTPDTSRALTFEIHEPGQETRTETVTEQLIKLGRDARAHVRFVHPSVARLHAVIEVGEDGVVHVIDLGSKEGTMLNGEPVNKAKLNDGDTLLFGDAIVRVGFAS